MTIVRSESRLQCGKTSKLLLRITQLGLIVWCKSCKRAHTIPWDVVDLVRADFSSAIQRADEECDPKPAQGDRDHSQLA